MWAVMIALTPAAIAARNGTSSSSCRPSRSRGRSSAARGVSRSRSRRGPGKCFAQATTPPLCSPRHECRHVTRHEGGIGAERADADDGVAGVRVDVGDGRQVEVDTDAARSAAIEAATRSVSSTSSTAPSARLPGYELPVLGLEPRDVAALLVDRDQHVGSLGADAPPSTLPAARGRGRCARRGRRRRARRPASRRAQSGAERPANRGRCTPRRGARGRAQPLTEPAVSPNAIFRCTSRKKITTGIAVRVDPAISPPQSVCRLVPV